MNPLFTTLLEVTSKHLAGNIMDEAGKMMTGFGNIGVGIGSIMLLFVVIYYVSSILDGGKFQLKMLWPLVLFILVCNFTVVSKPTLSFIGELSGGVSKGISNGGGSMHELAAKTGDSSLYPQRTKVPDNLGKVIDNFKPIDLQNNYINPALYDSQGRTIASATESTTDTGAKALSITYTNGKTAFIKTNASHLYYANGQKAEEYEAQQESLIGRALSSFWDKCVTRPWKNMWSDILSALSSETVAPEDIDNNLFLLIVFAILKFLVNMFKLVMVAYGSVMVCIFIAFGPIIWAFAIFPGMGKNIGSWFIRLVQFSLYGPVTNFIANFAFILLGQFCGDAYTAPTSNLLAVCASFGCAILMITQVPSICSMIIEGASGNASLSGGWHAMTGAIAAAMGGGTVASAARNVRVVGSEDIRDAQQIELLQQIANNSGASGNSNGPNQP